MSTLHGIAAAVFAVSGCVLVLLAAYPLLLALLSTLHHGPKRVPPATLPRVSVLVVVRNAESLIEAKIANLLAVDYPRDRLEIVFYSDGSTDRTLPILRRHEKDGVRALGSDGHEGKIRGINRAVRECTGSILVLTDGDALFEADAVRNLIRHFGDPQVGGVSGTTFIGTDEGALREAQAVYLDLNGRVKRMEAALGSVTANEGKIYAIRRELFRTIPEGVTDDLYVALAVIAQGYRFTLDAEAAARIRVPSRSPAHEVERRRRIVAQSLRGIFLMRSLLNPRHYGFFALALAVNKVLRRMMPFALVGLWLGSSILAFRYPWAAVAAAVQTAFYALALLCRPIALRLRGGAFRRAADVAYYVLVGQYGTLMGTLDFLLGRRVTKWEPRKNGGGGAAVPSGRTSS